MPMKHTQNTSTAQSGSIEKTEVRYSPQQLVSKFRVDLCPASDRIYLNEPENTELQHEKPNKQNSPSQECVSSELG